MSAATQSPEERRPRLVVVGAGMAAQRFCERLVDRGLDTEFDIVVIGEEREPPYDRIRLGERIAGASPSAFELRSPSWYVEHGISLQLGTRVVRIDRETRTIWTAPAAEAEGLEVVESAVEYHRLVLATGSSARVPELFQSDDVRIQTYRNAADADAIRRAAAMAPRGRCLVVGGGLLGIEVARTMQMLGAEVLVLEASTHLMSRQLDRKAAEALEAQLLAHDIVTRTGVSIDAVHAAPDVVRVHTSSGSIEAAMVVVAVGVRPNDTLAREAGLRCHFRGGVWVDETLRTDDPFIDAVGECAAVDGEIVGLAAPCFDMANALANRLAGDDARYTNAPRVTKLKLDIIEVAVVGEALADDPGYRQHEWNEGSRHRRLVTRHGHLVGATAVGAWDELPSVVDRVLREERVRSKLLARFAAGDPLFPNQLGRPETWGDDVPVCTCTGATCGAVRAAVAEGCVSVDAVRSRTGAGSVCGTCVPLVARLCGGAAPPPPKERALGAAALTTAGVLLLAAVLGPIGYATSVTSDLASVDVLWRDGTLRQITGFSLLGLAVLSLLLSLRKRVSWFRLSSYRAFRVLHSVLGVATLLALGVHTGFRLGANLDLILATTFLAVVVLGAMTAAVVALEPRLSPEVAVPMRRVVLRVHQVLFWPLPVLVAVHVIKTFYF